MQERAALVGASLEIESTPGHGADHPRADGGAGGPDPAGRVIVPDMAEGTRPLRILLADDHVTVRHGLKLLIDGEPDMKVVAEASDGDAAVQQALELKPDVVVMDISMPGMNGLVATRALKKAQPDAVIVTLTRHADDAYLQELLRAGVSGYVLKRSAPTELLQAIRGVAAGGQYLDSTLTARLTAGFITAKGGRDQEIRAGSHGPRGAGAAPDCGGLWKQGNRRAAVAQPQDGRGPQGERHAQARTERPYRHCEVRGPAGLAR